MAFKVENGSGYPDATSYVSVADADTYFTDRGNTAWSAADNTAKEQALVKATAFVDASYRSRYKGRRKTKEQSLAWPRYGASIDGQGSWLGVSWAADGVISDGFLIGDSEIPQLLKDCVCELAARALIKDLAPDIPASAGAISMKKVGPLQIEYKGPAAPYTLWRYAAMLIAPLLTGTMGNITMVVT